MKTISPAVRIADSPVAATVDADGNVVRGSD